MITTDVAGFNKADLYASGGAELHADTKGAEASFKVFTDRKHLETVDGWFFNEDACREASEFFLKLADELNRRKTEQ